MTGAWFLAGAAIGLTIATIYGYRRGRHIYQQQLNTQVWPLESDGIDIPRWVNQGNRAVIGQYDEILAAIHEAAHIELWETELEKEQGVGE